MFAPLAVADAALHVRLALQGVLSQVRGWVGQSPALSPRPPAQRGRDWHGPVRQVRQARGGLFARAASGLGRIWVGYSYKEISLS